LRPRKKEILPKVHKEGFKTRNLSNSERAEIHALLTDGNMNPKDVAS
jgi:hypothetical protein